MSQNIETINTYLDGFRTNDHAQILSCLTDDIEWTVFGDFRIAGKQAYDEHIEKPELFEGAPEIEIVRLVEEDGVIMAELTGRVRRVGGEWLRMAMGEVFVMRDGLIRERRAFVVPLLENDFR